MPGNNLKLEPWDSSQKDESFPQVPGATHGSWAGSASPASGCGGPGEVFDEVPSPRARSPNLHKRLVLANRDKESLLEEIIDLKKALSDQAYHLRLHKVHASAVQLENRKLEKDIEDLEVSGNYEAPRTGGPTRLRSKLQGLKGRLGDLQATCDLQHDELCALRRDIRVTRTREVEVERDIFAGEIGRLQKVVKRLKALQARITAENRELSRLKDKAARLELANQRLESCIAVVHKTLERANKEVTTYRAKANESQLEAKKYGKKIKELQEHATVLEGLLEKERIEKRKIGQKIKAIAVKKREWDKEYQAKQKRKQLSAASEALKKRKKKKKKKKKAKTGKVSTGATESGEGSGAASGETSARSRSGSSSGSSDDSDDESEGHRTMTYEEFEARKLSFLGKVETASHSFIEQEQVHYGNMLDAMSYGTEEYGPGVSSGKHGPRVPFESGGGKQHLYGSGEAAGEFDSTYGSGGGMHGPVGSGLGAQGIGAGQLHESGGGAGKYGSGSGSGKSGSGGEGETGVGYGSGSGKRGASEVGAGGYGSGARMYGPGVESGVGGGYGSGGEGEGEIYGCGVGKHSGAGLGKHGSGKPGSAIGSVKGKLGSAGSSSGYDIHVYGSGSGSGDLRSGGTLHSTSGSRTPSSLLSPEDQKRDHDLEGIFYDGVEVAADDFIDSLEALQFGGKGKVPKLNLEQVKAKEALEAQRGEEARQARELKERIIEQERETHRLAQELSEERRLSAQLKAERGKSWRGSKENIDVMVDHEKLEMDEFDTEVKDVKGRLSVAINLKRSKDHPYPGSPRAQAEAEAEAERLRQVVAEEEVRAAAEEAAQRRIVEIAEREEALRRAEMEAARREEEVYMREEARRLHEAEHDAEIRKNVEEETMKKAAEEARRKDFDARMAAGLLTPEELAELARRKAAGLLSPAELEALEKHWLAAGASSSEAMKKGGKLPFIDKDMQGFIKENIRGVLGHLENITEVIVHKQEELGKHKEGVSSTTVAAKDVLKAYEKETDKKKKRDDTVSSGSKPGTPRGEPSTSPGTPSGGRSHKKEKKGATGTGSHET